MRRDPRNDWQLFGNYYLAITIHFAILYRTWIEKKPLKPSQAEARLGAPGEDASVWIKMCEQFYNEHQKGKFPRYSKVVMVLPVVFC